MTGTTKTKIKEAFINLLSRKSLDQITVKNIVEESGINRNSFYYHYDDINALLEELLNEEFSKALLKDPNLSAMEDNFLNALTLISEYKRAAYNIFNSNRRFYFERYLMNTCDMVIRAYVDYNFSFLQVDEKLKEFYIKQYRYTLFGSVIDWMDKGMKDDIKSDIHYSAELINRLLEDITEGRTSAYNIE